MFGKLIEDIIGGYFISELRKTHRAGKAGQVVLPAIYLIIGIFLVIGGTLISLLGWLNREDRWAFGAFVAFALAAIFGLGVILGWCNCRIWYDDRQFTVQNILGIKHCYGYADITCAVETKSSYILTLRSGKVSFEKIAVGANEFAKVIRAEYVTCHNGHALKWMYK